MKINFKKSDLILLPNILSFFRILLIPVIVVSYLNYDNVIITVSIIILSGLTDLLDGYIARNFNMISDIGKILDPIADKLTQAVILGCLIVKFPHILIILITLIIKELITIITGFLSIKNSNQVYSANWHGKVTTLLLYGAMIIHIIWKGISNNTSFLILAICEVMMIVSFILYTKRNLKKF